MNEYENEWMAEKIYKYYGQDGVFKACNNGVLNFDSWKYCDPCEIKSPIYHKCCLVCGTANKED